MPFRCRFGVPYRLRLVVSFALQPFDSNDTNGEIDNSRQTGQ
jgi:hypothetical protein